jgi:hypothetical protein
VGRDEEAAVGTVADELEVGAVGVDRAVRKVSRAVAGDDDDGPLAGAPLRQCVDGGLDRLAGDDRVGPAG